MSTVHIQNIKGIGPVALGLDWIKMHRFDDAEGQIKSTGKSIKAKWIYKFGSKGQDDFMVAMLTPAETRLKPFAGATLAVNLVREETFAILVKIEDDKYWAMGYSDGLPAYKSHDYRPCDFVGELEPCLSLLRTFANCVNRDFVVFSNDPDALKAEGFANQVRPLELQEFSKELKKQQIKQASFARFTGLPIYKIAIGVAVLAALGVYQAYDIYAEQAQERNRQLAAKRSASERQQSEMKAIHDALNAKQDLRARLSEVFALMDTVPAAIGGWELKVVTCDDQKCQLAFTNSGLGTWHSYMKTMPKDWPVPKVQESLTQINQELPLLPVGQLERQSDALLSLESVTYQLGNLAQISKTAEIHLGVSMELKPLVGGALSMNQARSKAAIQKFAESGMPLVIPINVRGPAHMAQSFVQRLPANTAFNQIVLQPGSQTTFVLDGETYVKAN